MANKKIILKDNSGNVLYPKTTLALVEGSETKQDVLPASQLAALDIANNAVANQGISYVEQGSGGVSISWDGTVTEETPGWDRFKLATTDLHGLTSFEEAKSALIGGYVQLTEVVEGIPTVYTSSTLEENNFESDKSNIIISAPGLAEDPIEVVYIVTEEGKKPAGLYFKYDAWDGYKGYISLVCNDGTVYHKISSDMITDAGHNNKFVTSAEKENIADIPNKVDTTTYNTHVNNSEIHVTASDKSTWNAKQDALNAAQLAAVNSGITDSQVTKLQSAIDTYGIAYSGTIEDRTLITWNGDPTGKEISGWSVKMNSNTYDITDAVSGRNFLLGGTIKYVYNGTEYTEEITQDLLRFGDGYVAVNRTVSKQLEDVELLRIQYAEDEYSPTKGTYFFYYQYDSTHTSYFEVVKQVTVNRKINSDLVDDTNHAHKFVTAADKTKWDGYEESIAAEATNRATADTALDNKLNSTVYTKLMADQFSYSGDVVTFTKNFKNLKTGVADSYVETISLANSNNAGMMSPATVTAIQTLRTEVDQLKGQNIRLLYTAKDNPTAAEIQAFVQAAGYTDPTKWATIAVVVKSTAHVWRYFSNTATWTDVGIDTVNQFTNSTPGIIKGAEVVGRVYAEDDGTGSVYGWDETLADIEFRLDGKISLVEPSAPGDVAVFTRTGAIADSGTNLSVLVGKVSTLEVAFNDKVNKVEGMGLSANDFTNESATHLSEAYEAKHTHNNKTVLDEITQDTLNSISTTVAAKHTHDNKVVIDAINQATLDAIATNTTARHTHTNNLVLDNLTQTDLDNIAGNTTARHSHTNKAVLDDITSTNISSWKDASNKAHEHTNISELNLVKSGDVSKWDDATNLAHTHSNKTIIDSIDQTVIDAIAGNTLARHTHDNKAVLDVISQATVDAVNANTTVRHSHGNKSALDNLTQDTLNAVTLNTTARHEHTNKSELDLIQTGDKANWDDAYNKRHSHTNVAVLDDITRDTLNAVSANTTARHEHGNKDILEEITQDTLNTIAVVPELVADSHTHANKDELDKIESGDKAKWDAKQAALTFDSTPTTGSTNPVTSSGIKAYVDTYGGKIDSISIGGVAQTIVNKAVDLPAYPTTLPASDVKAWAKADTKPSYTAAEVGAAADVHNHANIYYDKSEVNNLLDGKANTDHNHNDLYYGKDAINSALEGKAAASHNHNDLYYGKDAINQALLEKADASHNHATLYYNKTEVNDLLVGKSDTNHTHDDRYYTESEVDNLLLGKAAAAHNHADLYYGKTELYTKTDLYTKAEVDTLLGTKPSTSDLHNQTIAVGNISFGADDEVKLVAGNNVDSIVADATNKTITINTIDTNTTYSEATTTASGLMSSGDKTKLNGIAAGAEVNQKAFSKVKVGESTINAASKTDTVGIVAGNNVTVTADTTNKAITISAQDTTYTAGDGLDLTNGAFTPNTSFTTDPTNKNYKVDIDSTTKGLFVNVPWTDTNTTYSQGSGLKLTGTEFSVNTDYTTSAENKNYAVTVDSTSGGLYVNVPWSGSTYTAGAGIEIANNAVSLKTDFVTDPTNKNYKVAVDSTTNSAYVNVPWTDTVYTHPSHTAAASGLYKVTVDSLGHVTDATAVVKKDITDLGIPAQDTTYSVADSSTLGLVKSSTTGTTAGRDYNVEVNSSTGTMKVNVPWTDTEYTHPAGSAASKTSGLYKFSTDSTSHIASVTAVTKSDITALGIPGQDTDTWRPVVDALNSTDTDKSLSANQGRVLNEKITNLEGRGRFLSVWNGSTGKPSDLPGGGASVTAEYTYRTGDYFIVGTAGNKMPTGTSIAVGTTIDTFPSTTGSTSSVNDTILYSGSGTWTLIHTPAQTVTFGSLSGEPTDNEKLANALNGKANSSHTHSASDITSGLATVATSGSYNDLINKPSIPAAANNAALSLQIGGTTKTTFYADDSTAKTFNITKSDITGLGIPGSDTNTWRSIKVNGTEILGTGTSTNALNLKAGNNVTLTNSSGTVTIDSSYTDTKVTSVGNHYTPTGGTGKTPSSSGTATRGSTVVMTGVTTDAAGHVTGVTGYTLPASDNTDTLNTAGATDTSSKIYLVGAPTQDANPQTYSDNEVYTTSGTLTTNKVQIGGGACTLEYSNEAVKFVF